MEAIQLYAFLFIMAMFLGLELINKVPSTLHTPLMSGSNAISGITVIGALALAGQGGAGTTLAIVLSCVAVALAMINVVGGYVVTDRMLQMFRSKTARKDGK
jgi:H+-translocating NAD(P) transhydrogenase subunit alpha